MIIVAILVAVVLPMLVGRPRINSRQGHNAVQLRGIHAGMVLWGQGGSNIYPGLDYKLNPVSIPRRAGHLRHRDDRWRPRRPASDHRDHPPGLAGIAAMAEEFRLIAVGAQVVAVDPRSP